MLGGDEVPQVPAAAVAPLVQALELLADVGDHTLGCVGRGGGPDVGDQVEDRGVGLVPDRRHDRRAGGGDRAHQRLVGERQQVLDRAAPARDHDHVDGRVAVEPLHGVDHLPDAVDPLHAGVGADDLDRGPAPGGVLLDVALRGGARARDQADPSGEEGQPALELGGEDPLGGQQLATTLEAGEELAEPDHADVVGGEREGAALGVVPRTSVDHDARALDHGGVGAVDDAPGAGDGHRDVAERIAQRDEDGVDRVGPVDLRDLTLDPDRSEAVDPPGHELGDLAQRCRSLRAGLERHGHLHLVCAHSPVIGAGRHPTRHLLQLDA